MSHRSFDFFRANGSIEIWNLNDDWYQEKVYLIIDVLCIVSVIPYNKSVKLKICNTKKDCNAYKVLILKATILSHLFRYYPRVRTSQSSRWFGVKGTSTQLDYMAKFCITTSHHSQQRYTQGFIICFVCTPLK